MGQRRARVDLGEPQPDVKRRRGRFGDKPVEAPAETPKVNYLTDQPFSDRYYEILEQRRTLPVYGRKAELLKLVAENRIVVMEGETGSGKTTQIPQFLAEHYAPPGSGKMVACTQPRRVAAMSVAQRVADEMDVQLGQHVGYTIRFEDRTSPHTVLKYMTDGMLLREAMTDPSLSRYAVIVLDEAHERTVSTDVLMGLLKELMERNQTLRLVVMSATLDAKKFQDYFGGAPLLKVRGRMHPVELFYSDEPVQDYVEAAVRTVVQLHQSEPAGDILLFLTGEMEIRQACQQIEEACRQNRGRCGPIDVYPLFSSLPPHEQQRIFLPPPESDNSAMPGRKVIVSTNIAETSLTIDGIVYVVDPGFCKQKVYNPRIRVNSLQVTPISRASANQRAGRAGRTRPGKCFRLYPEQSFKELLEEQTHPEMLRCNINNVVLMLLRLGVKDLVHFDFMDPPAPETLMRALEEMHHLGAIGDSVQLTSTGEVMSEFPIDPQLSKCLIASPKHGCSEEILRIVSLLSVPQCFHRPEHRKDDADAAHAQFAHDDGDHLTLLQVYQAYEQQYYACQERELQAWCRQNFLNPRSLFAARNVCGQLRRIMERKQLQLCSPQTQDDRAYFTAVQKAMVEGFFMQVAHLERAPKHYLTVKDNQKVTLHPSTRLKHTSQWVLFNEFVITSNYFVRTCTRVEGRWLLEIAPHYYKSQDFQGSMHRAVAQLEERGRKPAFKSIRD